MLDNNPLTGLIEPPDRKDSWRWGTVVSGSPVRVRLDGDSEASLATPDCLVSVTTGDRVRVHVHNRRMTIVGRMGGQMVSYPAPNIVTIGGTDYQLSGQVMAPAYSWTGQTSTTDANAVFYGSLYAPVPYTPPAGWTFNWSAAESSRWVFVENADRYPSGGTQRVRVIQIASGATDSLRLQWQLVRA